jgi:hypothetical protein
MTTVAVEPVFLNTNIVATMQASGVRQILTNNPKDFTPFASLITVIPLM